MSHGKIFFWGGLAFLGGVGLASWWQPDFYLAGTVALGGVGALIINRKWLVIGLLLVAAGLGMMRLGLARERPEDHVSNWNDQTVELTGVIVAEPEEQEERTKLTVAVDTVSGEVAVGRVLVLVPRYPTYDYGQRLSIKGKMQTPENLNDFDYQNYLARYDIYSTMYEPAIEVTGVGGGNPVLAGLLIFKKQLARSLQRVVPEPEAGFALGILLGQQAAVGQTTRDAFRASGTMHVMAVSGYNITIVATLLIAVTKRAGRRASFLLALVGIISFVLITGAGASVVRAALMGGLVLLAGQTGRVSAIRNVLVATAVVMVAQNPLVLRFDIGFQLSFMAVVGLVYVSPRIEKYLARVPKALMLRDSLLATLSANVMTLPITLVYFGQLSPLAPLINVALLPSIPAAMAVSFATALAGLVSGPLAQLLSYPTWLILAYGIKVVQWGASLPGATLKVGQETVWWVLVAYAGVLLMIWRPTTKKALKGRLKEFGHPLHGEAGAQDQRFG